MAMLAVPLSQDISRLFREIEIDAYRDPSDHITVFFFGDDLPMKTILKIVPVVYNCTENLQPFEISTSKITTFPKGDNGYPVIAELKSQKLEELREKIKTLFDKFGIKYDTTFDEYKPHVTLGYSKKKPKSIKLEKTKWTINQIGLFAGDNADSRLFVNFPFSLEIKNKDVLKTSYYCKIFEKLTKI